MLISYDNLPDGALQPAHGMKAVQPLLKGAWGKYA